MGSTFVPLGSLVWTEPFCWVPPQAAYAQHMLMNTWSCQKHCTVWQSHPGYHGILVSIISFDDLPKKSGTRWYHLSHYVQVVGSATTTIISWTIQIKLWSSRQKPIAFSKKHRGFILVIFTSEIGQVSVDDGCVKIPFRACLRLGWIRSWNFARWFHEVLARKEVTKWRESVWLLVLWCYRRYEWWQITNLPYIKQK